MASSDHAGQHESTEGARLAVGGGQDQCHADRGQHDAQADERNACDGKAIVFVHVSSPLMVARLDIKLISHASRLG